MRFMGYQTQMKMMTGADLKLYLYVIRIKPSLIRRLMGSKEFHGVQIKSSYLANEKEKIIKYISTFNEILDQNWLQYLMLMRITIMVYTLLKLITREWGYRGPKIKAISRDSIY